MRSKQARRILQTIIVLTILGFWGLALARNWQELAEYRWEISWPWLFLSMVVLVFQMILLATIWWQALRLMGERVSWRLGTSLWLKTQIARYIPGGIWDIAGRLTLGYEEGLNMRAMSASVVLEMALQVLSASVFLIVALWLRTGTSAAAYLPGVVVVAVGSLILLLPPVFEYLVNWALRLLRRPPLDMQLSYGDMLLLFLLRVIGHILLGVGLLFFARGLTPLDWSLAPAMVTSYIGAWLIGYLALLVPMGIGVREGVWVLLLEGQMPFGALSAIALGYRVWIAVRDLLAALAGVLLGREQQGLPGTVDRAAEKPSNPETGP
ncbi:MAG: lysylphosphatidylglycerol synthase domain-containing protein [Chloroflexota bacterium]|nr:lysylphosphatidylglycerol synthase domain-containing protein [Chloroflexota bacterium]